MRCEIADCSMEASFNFLQVESRRLVAEKHLCDAHGRQFFSQFRASVSEGRGTPHATAGGVCVDLEAIAYNNRGDPPGCVYVHEVGGKRRFAIMVDGWAWWALMAQVKQQAAPYPRTHAAWAATMTELGGHLQDVLVDRDSVGDRWSAKLRMVKIDGGAATVSVRASDAYTLALMCGVPIFVVETAIERFADRGEETTSN